jgi:hypothetical protein
MFTTESFSLNLYQEWKLKLSEWAVDGSLGAAADAAFRLERRPTELAALISQWAVGDFSALPPIVLLPTSSMPGTAGAYAISTGSIYLNQDWLAGATAAQVIAVLTEELGHHLDGLLNVVDTPGDEGKRFALALGLAVSGNANANDAGLVLAGNKVISVEQAAFSFNDATLANGSFSWTESGFTLSAIASNGGFLSRFNTSPYVGLWISSDQSTSGVYTFQFSQPVTSAEIEFDALSSTGGTPIETISNFTISSGIPTIGYLDQGGTSFNGQTVSTSVADGQGTITITSSSTFTSLSFLHSQNRSQNGFVIEGTSKNSPGVALSFIHSSCRSGSR